MTTLLKLEDAHKRYGLQVILDGAECEFGDDHKVGLEARNVPEEFLRPGVRIERHRRGHGHDRERRDGHLRSRRQDDDDPRRRRDAEAAKIGREIGDLLEKSASGEGVPAERAERFRIGRRRGQSRKSPEKAMRSVQSAHWLDVRMVPGPNSLLP